VVNDRGGGGHWWMWGMVGEVEAGRVREQVLDNRKQLMTSGSYKIKIFMYW
jgi:hypothetical protein